MWQSYSNGLLVAWRRALWLPALAWPVHVLTDVPTHGSGPFLTPLLWPFSDRGFAGWSWWQHPWLFYGGWILVGLLVLAVVALRLWRDDRRVVRARRPHELP